MKLDWLADDYGERRWYTGFIALLSSINCFEFPINEKFFKCLCSESTAYIHTHKCIYIHTNINIYIYTHTIVIKDSGQKGFNSTGYLLIIKGTVNINIHRKTVLHLPELGPKQLWVDGSPPVAMTTFLPHCTQLQSLRLQKVAESRSRSCQIHNNIRSNNDCTYVCCQYPKAQMLPRSVIYILKYVEK